MSPSGPSGLAPPAPDGRKAPRARDARRTEAVSLLGAWGRGQEGGGAARAWEAPNSRGSGLSGRSSGSGSSPAPL